MKFCDRHWSMARAAITERGLAKDIAANGEEAMQRALEGTDDPLMRLFWMISNRVLEGLGLGLLTLDENGADRCPQCEVSKACSCEVANCADEWTASAADFIAADLTEAKA